VLRLVPFAYMPSLIPRQVEWNLFARTIPFASAFPESEAGRPLHCRFRGLLSVYSRYGLHAHRVAYATFYTEGFSSFVASAAASVATGWNEPAPGRDFPPAEDQGLFTAHPDLPTSPANTFGRPEFPRPHNSGHAGAHVAPVLVLS